MGGELSPDLSTHREGRASRERFRPMRGGWVRRASKPPRRSFIASGWIGAACSPLTRYPKKEPNMTDPVFEGLAQGLKPLAPGRATRMRAGDRLAIKETLSVQEAAAINIAAKLDRLEKLQERAAEAAERQAEAMETLAALLASCIGVGSARCYAGGDYARDVPLNYLRSGNGARPFACDADNAENGND